MYTFSLNNLKGGVGKTSLVTNIAYFLADIGAKVLVVDNDPQGNSSQFFNANTELSLSNILAQEVTTAEVVQKTRYENIDIIPADMSLTAINLTIMDNSHIEQQTILQKALQPIRENYEFCLIDNPPSINISVLNALIVANEVICVATPDEYALNGISEMAAQIELARQYNPGIIYRGCVLNKMSGTSTSYHYLDQIKLNHPLFNTQLHYTKNWLETTTMKKVSIFELSPRCVFARDLKKFIKELLYVD